MEFCGCINIDCSECFNISIDYCPQSPININAGQTPFDNIYLWIVDKLDNVFYEQIIVKSDGSIDVDLNNFPLGMFTPDFGAIDIYLTSDPQGTSVLPISTLYPSKIFNCIILTVNDPVLLADENGCEVLTDDYGNPLIE